MRAAEEVVELFGKIWREPRSAVLFRCVQKVGETSEEPGGRVIEKQEPVLLLKSEILELIHDNAVELVGPLPEVWLGVPLLNSERVFGVMVVQSYDDPMAYDQESAEILRTVANQLSVYMEKKRAEENLREGEAIFRTFFEQNSVGFSITNAWGEWQLFNDKVCEITGYSREVFETLNWKDITPPEDFEREKALLEDMITGKTDTCSLEKRCVRADGSLTDITVSARAIGERSGTSRPRDGRAYTADQGVRAKTARMLRRGATLSAGTCFAFVAGGHSARYRQGRRSGQYFAETGKAYVRGVRDSQTTYGDRFGRAYGCRENLRRGSFYRLCAADHRVSSRKMGWLRLSAWTRRGGNSFHSQSDDRRGRLRRARHGTPIQKARFSRRGRGRHFGGGGKAFRSSSCGRFPRMRRRIQMHIADRRPGVPDMCNTFVRLRCSALRTCYIHDKKRTKSSYTLVVHCFR